MFYVGFDAGLIFYLFAILQASLKPKIYQIKPYETNSFFFPKRIILKTVYVVIIDLEGINRIGQILLEVSDASRRIKDVNPSLSNQSLVDFSALFFG